MADPTSTPLTDAEREEMNEVMISMQSAVADHICARVHPDHDIERGPCEECTESSADLLHDGWDTPLITARVAAARANERERIEAVRDRMTRHRDDMRQKSARTQRKEAKVLLGREAQSFDVAAEWLTAALTQPADTEGA